MIKEFEGLKKRMFCIEVNKMFYYNAETTTCVTRFIVPINGADEFIETLRKKFPESNPNSWRQCAYFTVVGTSTPTIDKYDKKRGEIISYSKCQRKAYSITSRVLKLLSKYHKEKAEYYSKSSNFLNMAFEREDNFLKSL